MWEAKRTWDTEAFVTCSNATANAMRTRIQSTEVNQLRTSRAGKSWTTTARI